MGSRIESHKYSEFTLADCVRASFERGEMVVRLSRWRCCVGMMVSMTVSKCIDTALLSNPLHISSTSNISTLKTGAMELEEDETKTTQLCIALFYHADKHCKTETS